MMMLIAAAALAAQTPAAPAAAARAEAPMSHEHMQMGKDGEHKGMDCCKDCCKDMAGKHESGAPEHHSAH